MDAPKKLYFRIGQNGEYKLGSVNGKIKGVWGGTPFDNTPEPQGFNVNVNNIGNRVGHLYDGNAQTQQISEMIDLGTIDANTSKEVNITSGYIFFTASTGAIVSTSTAVTGDLEIISSAGLVKVNGIGTLTIQVQGGF